MLSHPTTVPRKDRDLVRGRIAADRVRAEGGTATDAALEHVAAVIDQAAKHNRLKLHVENAMCRGAAHPFNLERYGLRAQQLIDGHDDVTIDAALEAVRRWLIAEHDTLPRAWASGRTRIQTLEEIRLLLRWLRRRRPSLFATIIHDITVEAA